MGTAGGPWEQDSPKNARHEPKTNVRFERRLPQVTELTLAQQPTPKRCRVLRIGFGLPGSRSRCGYCGGVYAAGPVCVGGVAAGGAICVGAKKICPGAP